MRHEDLLPVYAALVFSWVIVVIFGALLWLSSVKCASRWEQSGFETSYGPLQGCLVRHDGRWIPEENYREMR